MGTFLTNPFENTTNTDTLTKARTISQGINTLIRRGATHMGSKLLHEAAMLYWTNIRDRGNPEGESQHVLDARITSGLDINKGSCMVTNSIYCSDYKSKLDAP